MYSNSRFILSLYQVSSSCCESAGFLDASSHTRPDPSWLSTELQHSLVNETFPLCPMTQTALNKRSPKSLALQQMTGCPCCLSTTWASFFNHMSFEADGEKNKTFPQTTTQLQKTTVWQAHNGAVKLNFVAIRWIKGVLLFWSSSIHLHPNLNQNLNF